MIAFLTGRLAEKGLDHAVIEVGGVGFRLAMSTGSLAALPVEGDEVTVYTHLHVREDELALFGFENPTEKQLFTRLITVSGVGPKVALAALSTFSPDALVSAITAEDVAMVSSIPGVGKKTAQRIILELKDVLGAPGDGGVFAPGALDTPAAATAEARDALLSMGFSAAEAATALQDHEGGLDDAQSLLRHALRRLGGGA